jgi:hypothetical protein
MVLSLLMLKSMFKGVSQCILAVCTLFFGLLNSVHYLPLPHFSKFSIHILISSTFTDVMFCDIGDALLFFFPEFHRVVILLQTCSAYKFIYDHACFCVHVYLLDLSSQNMRPLSFWAWLTSPNMMSSNCMHLQSTCHRLRNTPLCIYTTFSWSVYQL